MNGIAKYVVSGTLSQDDLHWNNSTLIPAAGAVDAIRELKVYRPGETPPMPDFGEG